MTATLAQLGRGFDDPVHGAQQVFRTLLEAMSRPGRCLALPEAALRGLEPPAPGMDPATAALLLALLDADTPLRLNGGLDTAAASAWLRFHTGARPAVPGTPPAFLVVAAGEVECVGPWSQLPLGSDEAPQLGATLIVQVDGFDAADPGACRLQLTGPGIAESQALAVQGLPLASWHERIALQPLYPRGLDLVLVSGRRLCALPRSTRIALDD